MIRRVQVTDSGETVTERIRQCDTHVIDVGGVDFVIAPATHAIVGISSTGGDLPCLSITLTSERGVSQPQAGLEYTMSVENAAAFAHAILRGTREIQADAARRARAALARAAGK